MQFLLQATVLSSFFANKDMQSDAYDDVFREFTETLMSLVATPEATVRIRTLSHL